NLKVRLLAGSKDFEYGFEIQHRKGTSHGNVDALSRRPSKEIYKHCTNAEEKFGMETDISVNVLTTEDPWSSSEDGVLYRKWESDAGSFFHSQLILPKTRIQEVLRETHDSGNGGHFGVMKALSKTRERFYWDRLRKMVQRVPCLRSPKRTQNKN
ncbi:hypothetical protein AVEN_274870-1, partial [Araneus ventricosus]